MLVERMDIRHWILHLILNVSTKTQHGKLRLFHMSVGLRGKIQPLESCVNKFPSCDCILKKKHRSMFTAMFKCWITVQPWAHDFRFRHSWTQIPVSAYGWSLRELVCYIALELFEKVTMQPQEVTQKGIKVPASLQRARWKVGTILLLIKGRIARDIKSTGYGGVLAKLDMDKWRKQGSRGQPCSKT